MEPTSLNRTAATLAVQRVERHHRLLEELVACAPRPIQGADLARALETSVRTVQRDVAVLTEAGVPIRVRRGSNGGYALQAPRKETDLTLDTSEVAAVIAALVGIGPTTSGTARRLLNKLIDAIASP